MNLYNLFPELTFSNEEFKSYMLDEQVTKVGSANINDDDWYEVNTATKTIVGTINQRPQDAVLGRPVKLPNGNYAMKGMTAKHIGLTQGMEEGYVKTVDVDSMHNDMLHEHLLLNPALYENREDFRLMREFLTLHKTPPPLVNNQYVYASIRTTPVSQYITIAHFHKEHKLAKIDDQFAYFDINGEVARFPATGNLVGDALAHVYFFKSANDFKQFIALLTLKFSHYTQTSKILDDQDINETQMPMNIIKSKQKYAGMSPQEFHLAHKDKSEEWLKSMAWRHGYGQGSNFYVNKHKKGQAGISEAVASFDQGDKITWFHSTQFPEVTGTVVGKKDGNYIVQAVDPSPRNTEQTVTKYLVSKNNIVSQGVTEGVAETSPMSDAVKVLRHYGADHFKTTSNELHFYKNGRPFSVDLILNPDATRSVTLSSLNSATRGLKGQGVTEGLSKRDQKDVDAIKAAIERLQAHLKQPNADKDVIQARIAHETKRLALYKQGVAEGIMNTIANKVMGAAPEQPKYKVGQRVKYETSPHQPEWKDGGRGVGVITAYKNGHYMINGNPVNHFEIKGVVEQGVAEGWKDKVAGAALAGSMAMGGAPAHAGFAGDLAQSAARGLGAGVVAGAAGPSIFKKKNAADLAFAEQIPDAEAKAKFLKAARYMRASRDMSIGDAAMIGANAFDEARFKKLKQKLATQYNIQPAVQEGEIEQQHGDIKPWAYWSFPERVAKKLYQIHKGQPIDKSAIVQLWKTDGPDRWTKFMLKPDVSEILYAYQQMSEQGIDPTVEGLSFRRTTPDGIKRGDHYVHGMIGPVTVIRISGEAITVTSEVDGKTYRVAKDSLIHNRNAVKSSHFAYESNNSVTEDNKKYNQGYNDAKSSKPSTHTSYSGNDRSDYKSGYNNGLTDRKKKPVTEGLSWSNLDEGLSVSDKISIFEEFYTKGNLTESNNSDMRDYFLSLADMSDTLVKHKKYIVAPLSLVNNKIFTLDAPSYLEFLEQANDGLVFRTSTGEKSYPSKVMRDLSVSNTFAFLTAEKYNKFRTMLSLKFDLSLPELAPSDMQEVDEAKHGINKKVRIIRGPADAIGKIGYVGEVQHGMFKGAEKSYIVDYTNDDGYKRSIKLPASALRLVKDQNVEEARMSAAAKLSKAWDQQKAKSDASLARSPSSIPKLEPKQTPASSRKDRS